ncbi:unnamed protein product [Paramecium sonneborni]|uniref:Uncharacterized protein n=1 Tax=Paramecium sonneborni TaxID=65129 RepID=A0A8S1P751_9CILI|nr:unnamed protein product [Paramecium sonneborni]
MKLWPTTIVAYQQKRDLDLENQQQQKKREGKFILKRRFFKKNRRKQPKKNLTNKFMKIVIGLKHFMGIRFTQMYFMREDEQIIMQKFRKILLNQQEVKQEKILENQIQVQLANNQLKEFKVKREKRR